MLLSRLIYIINTKLIKRFVHHFENKYFVSTLGYCDKNANIVTPKICSCPQKIFLFENTNVQSGACFIINPNGENGKFIMKKNSGSSQNLTVITGLHGYKVGQWSRDIVLSREFDVDKDVIIEEDVRIGANVTLLPGITVGRGSIVGACSVITKNVPPYSIVAGNPAHVLRFKFTINQILEHETSLYPEEKRLPIELLEKNIQNYSNCN